MFRRTSPWIAMTVMALLPFAAAAAEPFDFGSPAAVTKANALEGRIVETRDGEELGRVQDFAVDLASGRVAYVVVSVGSFLIHDSLIAVAPDALRESADADGRLVLETDAATLRDARRFSAGDWPTRADVIASATAPGAEPITDEAATEDETPAVKRGTATIQSARKTATLSAGERTIHVEEHAEPAPAGGAEPGPERPAPTSRFDRLDSDGNGVLDRAEIAHELTRHDSYSDIDIDGNGTVDPGEFDALMTHRASAGNGEGSAGSPAQAPKSG